jgi:hypothetical protein
VEAYLRVNAGDASLKSPSVAPGSLSPGELL